ncbi:hypothetical protein SARC_00076 [Sphaeroforma arctica JP610]|uniref:Uncharacterized protein n=1 Tax=Sphaeroforma arctica JP610 TaxID=667725 RepID=A0A0L0GG27_9EUKA|nr:hypothetical protein SARC_00076 [Sphaeroforma arctica JP610]KNC87819.1 hypothetical protein SARC_00076 [Sphaeroforma arctica JP610]|eukprot:XP_014161721.1 hypothetical protein SARC_00076 [Sphaeroforma arctica JP610]
MEELGLVPFVTAEDVTIYIHTIGDSTMDGTYFRVSDFEIEPPIVAGCASASADLGAGKLLVHDGDVFVNLARFIEFVHIAVESASLTPYCDWYTEMHDVLANNQLEGKLMLADHLLADVLNPDIETATLVVVVVAFVMMAAIAIAIGVWSD